MFKTKFTEVFKEIGLKHPIVSAPMAKIASVKLAVEVSLAGGLGLIPAGVKNADELEKDLIEAKELLSSSFNSKEKDDDLLPIGVGFITFHLDKNPETLSTVLKHKPVAIWFSFGDYSKYVKSIRESSPKTKIISQIQSVDMLIDNVTSSSSDVDVLVVQSCESGGHGSVKGGNLITLLPESIDKLEELYRDKKIGSIPPVLAAGGLSDGRGLVAALSLGASGIVMGTRFVVSKESLSSERAKSLIINTNDGNKNTTRTKVYDELYKATIQWPDEIDGRALRNELTDPTDDKEEYERIKKRHLDGIRNRDTSYAPIYIGSGIGLIKKEISAKEIVESTIKSANRVINELKHLTVND